MPDLKKGFELAGRYTLVRKLGAGGAAESWLASDRLTRASVALKILVGGRVSSESLRKEWETSIRLMHAHIVRVFEFNEDNDPVFYSLQYIDGADISVLSGAPLAHILAPIALVADALRYAHGKGVVHRDIKADNVLLDLNGAPYLIDFGVAAEKGGAASGGALIAASPQSFAGEPPQPADDVFSLGGLIYELVSGSSAYSSASTEDDIRNVEPPTLVAANGDSVPIEIQRLVHSMLAKNAATRPNAEAVVAAIESAGFSRGAAPTDFVGSRQAPVDEIIERSAIKASGRGPVLGGPAVAQSYGSGISMRSLGIGLAVLLTILTGVVFLLPSTVTTETPTQVANEDEGDSQDEGKKRSQRRVGFSENIEDLSGRDERIQARAETEVVLGELLSMMGTLEQRAVQRWGGLRFDRAQAQYEEGDAAYIARNYALAKEKYGAAIAIAEPLLDQVDEMFRTTFAAAQEALEVADTIEALRLYELAVAISPSHAAAQAGFNRAKNLEAVLSLTDQGFVFEKDLELEAARQSFAQAVSLDPKWQPAQTGLDRVLGTIRQMEFDQRMTEGLGALAENDFPGARAAFRMAQILKPNSIEPADGLLQVDQGFRLNRIARLERRGRSEERNEAWGTAVETYRDVLQIDANLQFAHQGLDRSLQMVALHEQLEEYIANPDSLSAASTMSKATGMVVDITRMSTIGPRLSGQRDELTRLLKRAVTPLAVRLVSDNLTDVSIYKVGRLGSFQTHELSLRPGTYVAVGSRPGYRDVRLEFRVAPEIDQQPVVIRCEETI